MAAGRVLGYAARAVGGALEPFEFAPPRLMEPEVRVAVSHCGVCHTDLQAIDDYYGITSYPFVPGHEIVGYVTELGRAAREFREGDRVGIGWQARACGHCEWCLKGEPQLCMEIEKDSVCTPYGGFSASVIADHRFVHPMPSGMPSPVAAVLMCAGMTVFSALRASLTTPGMQVGVVGVGGLGHLAIQFARAMGCHVTALSSSPGKQAEALAFGAEHFVLVNDREAMRLFNYAHDLLLVTANAGFRWENLLMTLRKRGRLVLLGFPDVAFNSTDLVAHELTLTASFLGTPARMAEMLAFAQEHAIAPALERMAMSEVNAAVERLRSNLARYRIVLENPGS